MICHLGSTSTSRLPILHYIPRSWHIIVFIDFLCLSRLRITLIIQASAQARIRNASTIDVHLFHASGLTNFLLVNSSLAVDAQYRWYAARCFSRLSLISRSSSDSSLIVSRSRPASLCPARLFRTGEFVIPNTYFLNLFSFSLFLFTPFHKAFGGDIGFKGDGGGGCCRSIGFSKPVRSCNS